jgi:hypothetical protein
MKLPDEPIMPLHEKAIAQNQQRGRTAANNVIGNDVISVVQEVLTSREQHQTRFIYQQSSAIAESSQ